MTERTKRKTEKKKRKTEKKKRKTQKKKENAEKKANAEKKREENSKKKENARMCDSMGRVFLSHSRSARQLSGSQSVAGVHVQAGKQGRQTTIHKLKTR